MDFLWCVVGCYFVTGLLVAGFQVQFGRQHRYKGQRKRLQFDNMCVPVFALLDIRSPDVSRHFCFS